MKTYTVKPNENQADHVRRLPAGYGAKRDYPKIDLFLDGIYYGSTNWADTLGVAIDGLMARITVSAGTKVLAKRAE